jgi:Cytochrome b5-like Heme/Steroid binding domain
MSAGRCLNCVLVGVAVQIALVLQQATSKNKFIVFGFAPRSPQLISSHGTFTQKVRQEFFRKGGKKFVLTSPATQEGTPVVRGTRKLKTKPLERFDRTAATEASIDQPCLLTIDGNLYNVSAWAKAHPGGVNVLRKFHGKDATAAFHSAKHSAAAYTMLEKFRIVEEVPDLSNQHNTPNQDVDGRRFMNPIDINLGTTEKPAHKPAKSQWRQKLFTKEDPIGVHKYLGVFCLLHYIFRYGQMYFGDVTAGFGSLRSSLVAPICLIPHLFLSLSSLIFHTVPRERVVGKPMIWQEYRVHNIAFGVRSCLCTWLAWFSAYHQHHPSYRRLAVIGSCAVALSAQIVADIGTHHLRPHELESTTATVPFWEGCSPRTQKRIKTFYAYSQFMATLACIAVANPAWGFGVLIAIQLASLLMTLVRKGILDARGYHIGYTISLIVPYFVGIRSGFRMRVWEFPLMMLMGGAVFNLRRFGMNKYMLWIPIYAARILVGDRFISYEVF